MSLVAVFFGGFVLKMNPVILLGACPRAGTSTAASYRSKAKQSKLPALGHTVPCAIGAVPLASREAVNVL
jgi:putative transport protein